MNPASWTPFSDAPWSKHQRASFFCIVNWHRELRQLSFSETDAAKVKDLFEQEAAFFARREKGELLDHAASARVYALVDKEGLPIEWFTSQIKAAHHYYGPLRFKTGSDLKRFLQEAIVPQGFLVAKLADLAHRWQLPQVSELSSAYFLVKRLAQLKEDVHRDQLYIPLEELEQAGVTLEDLKQGNTGEPMQKLLWKQGIRVRDAFAQGQPLIKEVPRKFRRTFKKNWLVGLEVISEIERRNYDLWSAPIALTKVQQFQLNMLSFISQGAGRARGV